MADPVTAPQARRKFAVVSVLSLLLLTGCGRAPAAQPAAPASSAPASASAPLSMAGLEPCELLSPQDRSAVGFTALGKEKTIGEARACDWKVPSVYGVTVTLDETNGLDNLDVSTGERTKKTVGAHQALQVSGRNGTCAVLLGVAGRASVQVDVSNANFADVPLACRRASSVAELVEPKLP
ncbi:DUF3558 family protein [Amycolatopsis jiangsuensis]|uniref:DUF3558 domain-containing protein n=1 Tax=Amycolatopsis jiangsuensis TaxID=1181879 RepID=A0A840IKD4_9PSEU|nr:DUF3558 family protein [Amycolatopsis jiangsuensis]MBB4682781.1 hypothetical protein [Amycolatopsis jiangsuensis]